MSNPENDPCRPPLDVILEVMTLIHHLSQESLVRNMPFMLEQLHSADCESILNGSPHESVFNFLTIGVIEGAKPNVIDTLAGLYGSDIAETLWDLEIRCQETLFWMEISPIAEFWLQAQKDRFNRLFEE